MDFFAGPVLDVIRSQIAGFLIREGVAVDVSTAVMTGTRVFPGDRRTAVKLGVEDRTIWALLETGQVAGAPMAKVLAVDLGKECPWYRPLGFDVALTQLQAGKPMRRRAWAAGCRVLLIPGSEFEVAEDRPMAAAVPPGTKVTYKSHIDCGYPDGSWGPWSCDTDDLLATDWEVL